MLGNAPTTGMNKKEKERKGHKRNKYTPPPRWMAQLAAALVFNILSFLSFIIDHGKIAIHNIIADVDDWC